MKKPRKATKKASQPKRKRVQRKPSASVLRVKSATPPPAIPSETAPAAVDTFAALDRVAPRAPAPHMVSPFPLAPVAKPRPVAAALARVRAMAANGGRAVVGFGSKRSTFMALGFVIFAAYALAFVGNAARVWLGLPPFDLSFGLGAVIAGALPALIAQLGYTGEHFARRPA